MTVSIFRSTRTLALLAMFIGVLPAISAADEFDVTAVMLTSVVEIEGESIPDTELSQLRGQGDEGVTVEFIEQLSVILWDETGGGDRKTSVNSVSGSNNSQTDNLRMIRSTSER